MNWRVENACAIEVKETASTSALSVSLAGMAVPRICIGLCLLRECLISSLDLVDSSRQRVLKIEFSPEKKCEAALRQQKDRMLLLLGVTELEAWMHFFLRTVRDGIAEVDHVDLDVTTEQNTSATMVVKFPSSALPMTSDEMRQKLGL